MTVHSLTACNTSTSTFIIEKDGDNADNIWSVLLEDHQNNPGENPIVVPKTKEFTDIYSKYIMMSIKITQRTSATNKPCEDSSHHQIVTWTLECTRWDKTTDKLIKPSFKVHDSI